jgi:outer membrane protein assembly factor BamB
LHKYLLAVGAIILVSFLAVPKIVVGINIRNSIDKFVGENDNSDKCLIQDFYDCYNVKDIPDFFVNKNNYDPISQEIEEFQVIYPIEINQQIYGPMDSAWPMYCHDTRHTGRSPFSTSSNDGFNKWWFKSDYGFIEGSGVIDQDGVIYFGCWNNNLYAFYTNGTLKWKCDVGGNIRSSPAIDENGIIYAGDDSTADGKLFAIYPNGTIKWSYHIGADILSSPVIGDDGTIYFGDGGNWGINAINPNGTLKWRYKTDHIVYSSPAIGNDGTIYCGSHDTYLYALYPNNGTIKWKYKTGHWIRTSPCIGDDGTIYVVSLDNYLYALNSNGTRKWRTNVGAGTSPTIGLDGTIYCGFDYLYAVNPDGTVKWTFYPGSDRGIRGGTPCISAEGTIYFGTHIDPSYGGEIIAVNSDGTEKWRKKIANEWVDFAPIIDKDGTVYIGSSTKEETRPGAFKSVGYFYAFNEKDVNAPSTPKITGPTKVNSKTEIDYTFKSTSLLGNDVYFYINWGDGDWNIDYWLGPYASDNNVIISHTWSEPGSYTIRCRCKDSDNLWSDWREYNISVPRNNAAHYSFWLRFLDMFPILQKIVEIFN